jgi:HD-like signal output (HDOD) protein
MAKSKGPSNKNQISATEKKLIEGLRRHPALAERMQAIIELSDKGEISADQIEDLLVEEVRRLGSSAMESWAATAEEQAAREFKEQNPDCRYGKKKR